MSSNFSQTRTIAEGFAVGVVACAFVLMGAWHVAAQEVLQNSATPEAPSCFDYYHFGSVRPAIEPSTASTVSGTPITFSGTLTNENEYPLVDGSVYVKIFRLRTTAGAKDPNGPDVVDQFSVGHKIHIPAGGSVPIQFSWNVPSYAKTGDYEAAVYFVTSGKFNLLGLSFTDDIAGALVPFSVAGELDSGVGFDKSATTVNGNQYIFAAFPPRIGAQVPAVVRSVLINDSAEDATVSVMWDAYYWDAQAAQNRLDHQESSVVVPAHGSVPVSYQLSNTEYPVYLIVGHAHFQDADSYINVRVARDGIDRLRLNFPGLSAFPLKPSQEVTLFACVANERNADVTDRRLELSLEDEKGAVLASRVFTGVVDGAMKLDSFTYTPNRPFDTVVLHASLYQDNALVDDTRITYDCASIDPASCTTVAPNAQGDAASFSEFVRSVTMVFSVVAALFLLIAIALRLRK